MTTSADRNTQLYRSSDGLRSRFETYERYSQPNVDFRNWVLDRVPWRGDEQVLDVGSGPGAYFLLLRQRWPNIHYSALDYSPAMLAEHPGKGCIAQGDAQRLPFPGGSFDVVMANHMLYHVPDRDTAIAEFRRVLKPDGLLLTSINSMHTMPEFQALMRRALVLLGISGKAQAQAPSFPHQPYALENGPRQLAQHFYAVVRYDLPSSLVFPSIEPIMTYLDSSRELREPYLPPGIVWEDLMLVMREQIQALLGHFGELVVNKLSGALVASDRGGFIQDFVALQNGRKGF